MDAKQRKELFDAIIREVDEIQAERKAKGQTKRTEREKQLMVELDLLEFCTGQDDLKDGE